MAKRPGSGIASTMTASTIAPLPKTMAQALDSESPAKSLLALACASAGKAEKIVPQTQCAHCNTGCDHHRFARRRGFSHGHYYQRPLCRGHVLRKRRNGLAGRRR